MALQGCGSESRWSPHQRLPEYGCHHEGGASETREMERFLLDPWRMVLGGRRPLSSVAIHHHLFVPVKLTASFKMSQELVLVLSLRPV